MNSTVRPVLMLSVLLSVSAAMLPITSAEAGQNYGCFKVITPALNIRARPYSDAAVIGTASAGEIIEKRKRWCTLRGYWCAVRKGTVEGYADKNFLDKTACP
jgi:uncharacterized protein YraI